MVSLQRRKLRSIGGLFVESLRHCGRIAAVSTNNNRNLDYHSALASDDDKVCDSILKQERQGKMNNDTNTCSSDICSHPKTLNSSRSTSTSVEVLDSTVAAIRLATETAIALLEIEFMEEISPKVVRND